MDEPMTVKCAACGVAYPISYWPTKFVWYDDIVCLACMKAGVAVERKRSVKLETKEKKRN